MFASICRVTLLFDATYGCLSHNPNPRVTFFLMQFAVGEYARPQPATALQPVFGTRPEDGVHPVTRFALLHTGKAHALNLEFSANQRVQICAGDNHITPGGRRLGLGQVQFEAERVEDFLREEGDLAFVVFLEVEEPVAPDATASDALGLIDFDHGVLPGRLSVMAKEVVPWRDE